MREYRYVRGGCLGTSSRDKKVKEICSRQPVKGNRTAKSKTKAVSITSRYYRCCLSTSSSRKARRRRPPRHPHHTVCCVTLEGSSREGQGTCVGAEEGGCRVEGMGLDGFLSKVDEDSCDGDFRMARPGASLSGMSCSYAGVLLARVTS